VVANTYTYLNVR